MDRRTFLAGTGVVLLTAPLAGEAQQAKKVWRIGFLSSGSSPANLAIKGPFRAGLHDLGYVEGRDFVMGWRWAEGHQDRLPGLATDLVRGHRTAAVFRRYDITTESDIREAMCRTQAHIARQPTESRIAPVKVESEGIA